MRVLHLDFETRGVIDLKKVGAHRYAEDPHTSIILGRYCFEVGQDYGDVRGWEGELPPDEVVDHVAAGGMVVAHNAAFERSIWNARILPLTGVPLFIDQMDCTQARGVAAGLPASLEALGSAVRAPITKDKDGHRVMMKLCKPKKVIA